jgi:hypothetical protein
VETGDSFIAERKVENVRPLSIHKGGFSSIDSSAFSIRSYIDLRPWRNIAQSWCDMVRSI